MTVSLPNTITNESTRDARPIQANFQAIEDAFNNDYFPRDGTVAMTGPLTLSGAPVGDLQAATKLYVDQHTPAGVILDYAGASAPAGWLLCQGQLVDKALYPTLYALIGTTYGAETGSQFRVPDLQDRVAVGKGSTFATLAATGGSKDAVVVSHNHTQDPHSHTATSTAAGLWMQTGTGNPSGTMASPTYPGANGDQTISITTTVNSATATNQAAGVSGTNANMQPYIVLNKIIRAY